MARCRFCHGPKQNPLAPCCNSFECKSAAIAERNRAKMAKAPKAAKPISLRQKRSTGAPTVAEKAWMDSITALGCIVCRLQGRGFVPAAVHHIKQGNLRLGHLFTIPLCDPGHHQNSTAGSGEISRHPDKARFEAAYGSEMYLLEETKKAMGLKEAA